MAKTYTVIWNDVDGEARHPERRGKGRRYLVEKYDPERHVGLTEMTYDVAAEAASRWNRENRR